MAKKRQTPEDGGPAEGPPDEPAASPEAADAPAPPDDDAPAAPPVIPMMALGPPEPAENLEDRLRRLEQALRGLEEMQRQPTRPGDGGIRPPDDAPPRPKGPTWLGRAVAWFNTTAPAAPLTHPAGAGPTPRPPRAWFWWDALADARAIVRMYTDPRYTLTWMGRLLPPALLVLFLTIQLWLPYLLPCVGWVLLRVPALGWVLEKVLELVIGFFLFRALGQEARRYRETAPDLPPSLRL